MRCTSEEDFWTSVTAGMKWRMKAAFVPVEIKNKNKKYQKKASQLHMSWV